MKKILLSCLFLFTFFQFLSAQYSCDRWYMDANYIYTQPLSDFKTEGFKTGHGFSLGAYYALNPFNEKIVFHPGLRFDAVIGKPTKDEITLTDPAGAIAKTRVYNALIDFKLLGRFIFFPQAKINPYLEGFGGFIGSAGKERLRLEGNYPQYDEESSEQVVSQGNWVVGAGAGLLLKLSSRVDFDLRVDYNYSPELSYIDMDSYEKVEDNLRYDFSKTAADFYTVRLGFRFRLGCNNDSYGSNNNRNRNNRSSSSRKRGGKKPTKRTPSSSSRD